MADSSPATGDLVVEVRPSFTLQVAVGARSRDDRTRGDWRWFTSQGVGFVDQRRWDRASAGWMPTIGVTHATPQRQAQVFLTAVIGGIPPMDIPKCVIWCLEETDVVKRTLLMIGLSAGRLRRRPPPPARRGSRD